MRSEPDARVRLSELRFLWAGEAFGVRVAPEVAAQLERAFGAFLTAAEPALWLEADPAARTQSPFDPHVPKVTRAGAGLAIAGEGYRVIAGPEGARISGIASPETIAAALRILLAESVTARGGLLLHSVALAHGGRAALFVGHSGAGKTTLGKWGEAGGLELVADELVAVLPAGEQLEVFGTPWNVGRPLRARLSFLGTLAHGPSAVLDPIAPTELFRALLPNTLLPNDSEAGRAAIFRLATATIARVPAYRLMFAPEPGVAQVIRRALSEGGA